jgi:hypothetical protein
MISEIIAAIQSAKVLNDLVKAARELKNYNEFVAAVSEVSSKLIDAQAAALTALDRQLSLTNRVSELEKDIMELKNWESEAKRYQLERVPSGFFAYVLKRGMEMGEPPHELCANCFQKRQKSIIQYDFSFSCYVCHNCKTYIRTS